MSDESKAAGLLHRLRNQASDICDLAADTLEMSRETIDNLSGMYDEMASEAKSLREEIQRVKAEIPCPDCNGTGLPMCGPKCEHYRERTCVDVYNDEGLTTRCGVCSTCQGAGGK